MVLFIASGHTSQASDTRKTTESLVLRGACECFWDEDAGGGGGGGGGGPWRASATSEPASANSRERVSTPATRPGPGLAGHVENPWN